MSTIKKAFIEIAQILHANENKKVKTILPQLLELMTAKNSGGSDIGKTFMKDDEGSTYAVFCYYHKKWELISDCEYGSKKGTASGLNTMCKEGVSHWTKQQRVAKKAKEQLLADLASGELVIEDLGDAQAKIEEQREVIVPREDEHGYDTSDQVPKLQVTEPQVEVEPNEE